MKRTAAPANPSSSPRTVAMPPLSIRAEMQPSSISEEARTVELIFSTGAAVERYDWASDKRYLETLSMEPGAVRLGRLNSGAPLLDSHSAWSVSDMLGAVVQGSASVDGKQGRATAQFSRRDAVQPIWQDVRDGLIRAVSVGYRVYKFEETQGKANALPVRRAVDWEPFEVSMVPMPADPGAHTREGKGGDTNQCEIETVTRSAEPAEPQDKEPSMRPNPTPEFLDERQVADDPPPAPTPTEPNERDAGAAAERVRVQGILVASRVARLPRTFADQLIKEGQPLLDCQSRIFAEMSARGGDDRGPGQTPSGAEVIGDDPLVHARAGIVNAILHRIAPERFVLEDIGRSYRGMSILDIGRAFLNARGVRTSRLDRSQLVDLMLQRAGMHTTSDFPSLLEDAANKNLRTAYAAAPQTWRVMAKTVNLSDFKPSRQLQIGDAPALEEVLEHGEYHYGTIGEAKETVQLKTYGKVFAITRQALINDDLNAFGEVPAAFGRKAADKESDLAWAEITGNPVMGDGVVLFHTTHANYTSSGTAIGVDSLGVARAALRLQKGIDGTTLLNLAGRFLIVPAAKETIADQYTTAITAAAGSNVNPFANGRLTVVAEPRLDGASVMAWYMATDPTQAPVLYYGTLDGQGGPMVTQQEGFDVDGMKFRCRIDVALKAADFRAIYKNAGA